MSGEHISESAKAKHYKELLVWQRSMALAKFAYQLVERLPANEKFGLTAMIRRSAVLIPSSIAKGQARHETRDFLTQLSFADGYLAELETQLLLSVDLGFCKEADVESLLKEIDELQRMLSAITRKLAANSPLATNHSSLPPDKKKDSF